MSGCQEFADDDVGEGEEGGGGGGGGGERGGGGGRVMPRATGGGTSADNINNQLSPLSRATLQFAMYEFGSAVLDEK